MGCWFWKSIREGNGIGNCLPWNCWQDSLSRGLWKSLGIAWSWSKSTKHQRNCHTWSLSAVQVITAVWWAFGVIESPTLSRAVCEQYEWVNRHIPSIINLTGEYVRIWYPNQPKSCRNCGALDHLVRDCKSVHCFNCEKPGHRLEECEEPPKCTACKSEDHRLADCRLPFTVQTWITSRKSSLRKRKWEG